ncbi:GGDEF domain-containing protein [Tsukamurella sputi]|uniref:GGDEF domain-containing protein n=1 Tax=Tsukamurella sputi TaxID=2591848 RepID=A0A5C5RQA5_9ACTN|nr:GGDEF domain-containing protein [Tsukamurella sputi]TWS24852.1 GGDEF domain-containing protein [Tsukamurella sputi]
MSWRRLARRARRELFDVRGWRTAGQEEYAYATESIRYLHGTRALQVAVALLAMMMLPLSVVMQFNPVGPQGVPARAIHFGAALVGFLLGLRWLVGRWPTARQATWFLIASDALIGIGVSMLSDPVARICGAIHLAMLGLFAAFFLGWRILVLHCVYALALIAGLTGYAILAEGRTPMDLYIYTTPAITTVVGLPVVIQVVVETGRHGMTRVTREWYNDSLTGVYNRRGIEFAVRRITARTTPDAVLVVGMLDLDAFKQYNDSRGHAAGDELLVDVAAALDAIERLIVGRTGGDEFAVFAVRGGSDDAMRTVDEIRGLVRARGTSGAGIPASVGIVLAPGSERDRFEALARDADAALYDAKRSPVDAVIVRDLTVGAA